MQIDPPWTALERDPAGLTEGEWAFLRMLADALPDDWECYVQPHLNGLRPDIVLLHPYVGVAVYEVKDWSPGTLDLNTASLRGQRGPKGRHPLGQVAVYRKELADLLDRRLEREPARAVEPLVAGIVFTEVSSEQVQQALVDQRVHFDLGEASDTPILGRDDLVAGDPGVFIPALRHSDEITGMTPHIARRLRTFLVEPDVSRRRRAPLRLTRRQEQLATTRTKTGFRRIRGPAGSGKSQVLAARAANLALEGQRVLVITFNITLWHYLRDLVARHLRAIDPTKWKPRLNSITFLHYHQYCRRLCLQAGLAPEYRGLFVPTVAGGGVPNKAITRLARQALDEVGPLYDAVLVDEGQDLDPEWWQVLRHSVVPEGERVLVADASQDLYDRARRWTDHAMTNAGFGGPWTGLESSHRLSSEVADMLADFGSRFLDEGFDAPSAPERQDELFRSTLRWVTTTGGLPTIAAREIAHAWQQIESEDMLAIADVFYVCDTTSLGLEVTKALKRDHGIKTCHTFEDESRRGRKAKTQFWAGDARVKGTTPQSIKGWESRAVVVVMKSLHTRRDYKNLYVAMSRVKAYEAGSLLTVVVETPALLDFASKYFAVERVDAVGVGSAGR